MGALTTSSATLWLSPLVRLAAGGVPHPLNEYRSGRFQLSRALYGSRLGRLDRACALRVWASDRVVAVWAFLNKDLLSQLVLLAPTWTPSHWMPTAAA
jgi:hypothetical protein